MLAEGTPVEFFVDTVFEGRADQKSDEHEKGDGGDDDPGKHRGIGKQHRDKDEGEDEIKD
ncbi:hypothetical protein D3C87_1957300 [compost metagenome]